MSNVPKNNVKYSFSKDGLYGYGEMYDESYLSKEAA